MTNEADIALWNYTPNGEIELIAADQFIDRRKANSKKTKDDASCPSGSNLNDDLLLNSLPDDDDTESDNPSKNYQYNAIGVCRILEEELCRSDTECKPSTSKKETNGSTDNVAFIVTQKSTIAALVATVNKQKLEEERREREEYNNNGEMHPSIRMKARKKTKDEKNTTVVDIESVTGYRGKDPVDMLVEYIESNDMKMPSTRSKSNKYQTKAKTGKKKCEKPMKVLAKTLRKLEKSKKKVEAELKEELENVKMATNVLEDMLNNLQDDGTKVDENSPLESNGKQAKNKTANKKTKLQGISPAPPSEEIQQDVGLGNSVESLEVTNKKCAHVTEGKPVDVDNSSEIENQHVIHTRIIRPSKPQHRDNLGLKSFEEKQNDKLKKKEVFANVEKVEKDTSKEVTSSGAKPKQKLKKQKNMYAFEHKSKKQTDIVEQKEPAQQLVPQHKSKIEQKSIKDQQNRPQFSGDFEQQLPSKGVLKKLKSVNTKKNKQFENKDKQKKLVTKTEKKQKTVSENGSFVNSKIFEKQKSTNDESLKQPEIENKNKMKTLQKSNQIEKKFQINPKPLDIKIEKKNKTVLCESDFNTKNLETQLHDKENDKNELNSVQVKSSLCAFKTEHIEVKKWPVQQQNVFQGFLTEEFPPLVKPHPRKNNTEHESASSNSSILCISEEHPISQTIVKEKLPVPVERSNNCIDISSKVVDACTQTIDDNKSTQLKPDSMKNPKPKCKNEVLCMTKNSITDTETTDLVFGDFSQDELITFHNKDMSILGASYSSNENFLKAFVIKNNSNEGTNQINSQQQYKTCEDIETSMIAAAAASAETTNTTALQTQNLNLNSDLDTDSTNDPVIEIHFKKGQIQLHHLTETQIESAKGQAEDLAEYLWKTWKEIASDENTVFYKE